MYFVFICLHLLFLQLHLTLVMLAPSALFGFKTNKRIVLAIPALTCLNSWMKNRKKIIKHHKVGGLMIVQFN